MAKTFAIATTFVVLALANQDAVAQHIFKCQNAAGGFEFSDAPCRGSRSSERLQIKENSIDTSGSREHQLRWENEQLKEQLRDQQRTTTSAGSGSQRTQPDLQAERIDTFACEKAKRDYEVTASSNANNRAIVEARRSIMYGTCGMREPDTKTVNRNDRIKTFVR